MGAYGPFSRPPILLRGRDEVLRPNGLNRTLVRTDSATVTERTVGSGGGSGSTDGDGGAGGGGDESQMMSTTQEI